MATKVKSTCDQIINFILPSVRGNISDAIKTVLLKAYLEDLTEKGLVETVLTEFERRINDITGTYRIEMDRIAKEFIGSIFNYLFFNFIFELILLFL
jgi:hypothetical protein